MGLRLSRSVASSHSFNPISVREHGISEEGSLLFFSLCVLGPRGAGVELQHGDSVSSVLCPLGNG